MGIHPVTNVAKLTIIHLSRRRLPVNSGVCNWNGLQFLPNLQQCRLHARFPHNLSKISNSATSRPFNFSLHHRPYSSIPSPSSSNQKMGFLAWYLRMLDVRPILTKSVSSCLIYAAADLTSQMMTVPISGSFDLVRTLRMAAFGLLILGPAQHKWFNFLGRVLPKRDMVTTLKKLIVGQVSYGPAVTAIFFTFNAALQGESGSEIASRLERDLIPTIFSGLMYWPVCDFFTYKIIPIHLQPLLNSSFSYLWTIYLTYMASLEKAVAD